MLFTRATGDPYPPHAPHPPKKNQEERRMPRLQQADEDAGVGPVRRARVDHEVRQVVAQRARQPRAHQRLAHLPALDQGLLAPHKPKGKKQRVSMGRSGSVKAAAARAPPLRPSVAVDSARSPLARRAVAAVVGRTENGECARARTR